MLMSIDFNGIKNTVISAYQTVSQKAVEWAGRGIAVLKSGTQAALPHLQDKRIAIVSLIAVNLILVEVGNLFNQILIRVLPNETENQKAFKQMANLTVGLGTVISGVALFSKYANLPLGWLAVTGISVATVYLRGVFSSPNYAMDDDVSETGELIYPTEH